MNGLDAELPTMLRSTAILACVLPLTPQTTGLLNGGTPACRW
ncbi:hypothetical protein [Paraburkholderia sp. SG-MS1]|nr:hypothetical protein [Paraburkholderia sp. SG-MS1]